MNIMMSDNLVDDNMNFIHEFTRLLMQIKALNILFECILSYFECISIISCNFRL